MAKRSASDILKRILLSFRRNWGLKLVSLLFAAILWNYIIAVADPVRTVRYGDIRMGQPKNLDQLKAIGLTIRGDVSAKNVTVYIDLPRSQESALSNIGVSAQLDLSGITQEGKQNVNVSVAVSNPKAAVKSYSPKTVTVTVERLAKGAVPVVWDTTGSLPENFWMGPVTVTPQVLQISGAVSDVESVKKAIVHIPLDNLKADYVSALGYDLLDINNAWVSPLSLAAEPTNCIVNFQVFPTKLVPVDLSHSLNIIPARGYEISGPPSFSPDKILIAGLPNDLAKIGALPLNRIEEDNVKGDVIKIETVQLPAGVYAVSGNSVNVLVRVAMKTVTRAMSGLPIEFTGLGDGLKPDKPYVGSVTFTCPELFVEDLKASRMHLKADASGLVAGTHTLAVTASYDDPDARLTDIRVDHPEIVVTIVSPAP